VTHTKEGEVVAETSKSVCPKCLDVIDCQIVFREGQVFLQKRCDKHGPFEVLVYSDVDDYLKADKYNKPGTKPLHLQGHIKNGCPNDCGICEDHLQHTCVGIIEITDRCNMECRVCFADSGGTHDIPLDDVKQMIDLYVKCEGAPEVLQISGGEPTLHNDILEILEYAGQKGILYPMLNTNGIRLANRDFALKVSQTIRNEDTALGTPLIYLQFDGLDDEIYNEIRGRPLLEKKMKALENCREFELNVILVPTIVKGVNDHQIGRIIEMALNDGNIKGVNFQPSTLCGRYELENQEEKRMTLPDVLNKIEEQTSGKLKKGSFINVPCPYPTCSACTYVFNSEDDFVVLTDMFELDSYMDFIVNRALPYGEIDGKLMDALDNLLSMSAVVTSDKTKDAICVSCGMAIPNIKELVDNITLISVHCFMDESNFDLKRAKKCCVTEILPDGRMIPFCVYNILYRKGSTQPFDSSK